MSVYRRPDSPYYQYDFQHLNTRFHGSTKKTTKRKAEQVEAEIRAKVEAASRQGTQRNKVTLNQATGEFWINVAQHEGNANTVWGQLENLNRVIGKDTRISAIDDSVVALFVATRRGEPHSKYKKRKGFTPPLIGPATVNRETELLRRVITRTAKVLRAQQPDEPDRPEWKIHILQEPDPPDRPLTFDQETRLMDELVAHLRPIVDVALLTGLRLNEIVTLDCANIDFQNFRGRVRRKSKKPGREWFTFNITEQLIEILEPHVASRTDGPVWRFGPHCDCSFCKKKTNHGKPITSIRTAWEGARRRADVPDFRFHDLRHTVGSRVMAATGNLKAAQDVLGHKDISTTQRYAHHAPNALADIQRQLARMRPGNKNATAESRDNPEIASQETKKHRKIKG